MRRICKQNPNGSGVIVKGKHYDKCVGSRAEVGHKTAYRTSGGLVLSNLKLTKRGRWVSRKLSKMAKSQKRLEKAGYFTRKGKFGSFHKSESKSRRARGRKRSRKGTRRSRRTRRR